jgi:hypothetical protein
MSSTYPKFKEKVSFYQNHDPFVYSLYEYLNKNKVNFIWLGCS